MTFETFDGFATFERVDTLETVETPERVETVELTDTLRIQGGGETPETLPKTPPTPSNEINKISLSTLSTLSTVSRTPFVRAREGKRPPRKAVKHFDATAPVQWPNVVLADPRRYGAFMVNIALRKRHMTEER